MEGIIQWEEGCNEHQHYQIDSAARKETKTNFGFIPGPRISTPNHINARQVLGDTATQEYFDYVTNKSFHDLTAGKSIPAAAACRFGNGLKFIPNPKKLICRDNINKAMRQSTQDTYLKSSLLMRMQLMKEMMKLNHCV